MGLSVMTSASSPTLVDDADQNLRILRRGLRDQSEIQPGPAGRGSLLLAHVPRRRPGRGASLLRMRLWRPGEGDLAPVPCRPRSGPRDPEATSGTNDPRENSLVHQLKSGIRGLRSGCDGGAPSPRTLADGGRGSRQRRLDRRPDREPAALPIALRAYARRTPSRPLRSRDEQLTERPRRGGKLVCQ
jgi:hypothetical protein